MTFRHIKSSVGFAHDFQPEHQHPIISIHSVGKTHATGLVFDTELATSCHSRPRLREDRLRRESIGNLKKQVLEKHLPKFKNGFPPARK